MSYFAVIRDAGPAWTDGKGAFEQPDVEAHVAFMDALADEGLVLFAGPLAGSEQGRLRALVIVDTDDETAVHARLAADPWAVARRIVTTSVEPWNLFVGADRMAAIASHHHRPRIDDPPSTGESIEVAPPSGLSPDRLGRG